MLYLIVNIICLVSSRTPTITNYVNQMKTTWNAINYERWQNKPEEFFSRFFNVIINKDEYQYKEIDILADLPTSFSSQQKWNGCRSIGIIPDQGNCGSCWAVSAASVMSDRLCINQSKDIRISAEDLLSCCGLNCGYGCDGGTLQGAWKYFKSTGIVSGGEYNNYEYCKSYSLPPCNHGFISSKYNKCDDEIFLISLTPQCKKSCDNQIKNYENEKVRSRTDPYIIISKEEAIMTEIYNYGPVQAIFEVYSDFLNYKSGVYQHVTGNYLGNHAIKIIGWGVENGIKYWEAINSWNEEWGMQGRFNILKGINHLEIESHITAAEL